MQCSAMHCTAVSYNAGQRNTVQCSAIQCNAMQGSAMQCCIIQCCAMHWSAMQCRIVQCIAVHWIAMQWNSVYYISIDYTTLHCIISVMKAERPNSTMYVLQTDCCLPCNVHHQCCYIVTNTCDVMWWYQCHYVGHHGYHVQQCNLHHCQYVIEGSSLCWHSIATWGM